MRDVLILPVTGHRDLANMCSGGDLDGDDYLIIWDPELIPEGDSHPPMSYEGPKPTENEAGVTTADMAKFFVQHIKYDNLSRIATSHRYRADQENLGIGVKDEKCIELAHLHSKAVDYAKTGVPAEVPQELRIRRFPHWANRKNASAHNTYKSAKILGQLFDLVNREPFEGAWKSDSGENGFDDRILSACEPSEQMLQDAREVKKVYDEAMQRIMTQYGIKTEFEVFTAFVLDHHQDINDYKLAEKMGEAAESLKQYHRDLCYEKAGIDSRSKDWEKLKAFIVAMYRVTAQEVHEAYVETEQEVIVGGHPVRKRPLNFENMPFMSFPWIFMRELGQIATRRSNPTKTEAVPRPALPKKAAVVNKQFYDRLGNDYAPEPPPEVNTDEGAICAGDTLDLFHGESRKDVAPHADSKSDVPPTPSPAPVLSSMSTSPTQIVAPV